MLNLYKSNDLHSHSATYILRNSAKLKGENWGIAMRAIDKANTKLKQYHCDIVGLDHYAESATTVNAIARSIHAQDASELALALDGTFAMSVRAMHKARNGKLGKASDDSHSERVNSAV